MPHAGQTLENPVTKETIHFRKTATETAGQLLELELTLPKDGRVPGAHIHPAQEERFHVTQGTLAFRLGRKKLVASRGETVVVPRGSVHSFKNAGSGVARARVEVIPALKMAELLETTHDLAREGKVTRKGMPKPLHLALFVREYRREVRAAFPPPMIVHALMAPLAAIARLCGHGTRYAEAARAAVPASVPAI